MSLESPLFHLMSDFTRSRESSGAAVEWCPAYPLNNYKQFSGFSLIDEPDSVNVTNDFVPLPISPMFGLPNGFLEKSMGLSFRCIPVHASLGLLKRGRSTASPA